MALASASRIKAVAMSFCTNPYSSLPLTSRLPHSRMPSPSGLSPSVPRNSFCRRPQQVHRRVRGSTCLRRVLPLHFTLWSQPRRPSVSAAGTRCHSQFSERPLPSDVLHQATASKLVFAAEPAIGHDLPGHPENNRRVVSILEGLSTANLIPNDTYQLENFPAASLADLQSVHSQKYVLGLPRASEKAEFEGPVLLESFGQTYATSTTFSDLCRAAGAGLSLIDIVAAAAPPSLSSSPPAIATPVGFSIVRPPGHHAVPDAPMGFCVVGNVSVAARYAQAKGFRRVLILDFDVHHGNGTQDIFYEDPDVLFISTHQDDWWPFTGGVDEVGRGAGEGSTINVPLPSGAGDAAMALVMDEIVGPAAARFRPDIILVSAGYDAHYMDPLASLQFQTSTYHRTVRQLQQLAKQLCHGRMVLFLEGGYNLEALPGSVVDSFLALLGEAPHAAKTLDVQEAIYEEPTLAVKDIVAKCKSIHGL